MSEPIFETTPLENLICDTSVIINLDTLGYVDLVAQLYRVIIPHRVKRELQVQSGRKKPDDTLSSRDDIEVRRVDFRVFNTIDERLGEDRGETAAIALAYQLKALVALDEYRAQIFCSKRNLPYISTITLLGYIHDAGLNQRSMRNELTLLRSAGVTISDELLSSLASRYR